MEEINQACAINFDNNKENFEQNKVRFINQLSFKFKIVLKSIFKNGSVKLQSRRTGLRRSEKTKKQKLKGGNKPAHVQS